MRRLPLVELEDLPWCPSAVRDGATDWLSFMANVSGVFGIVAPKIRAAMAAAGTSEILDLCSGGGGPWLTLEREIARSGPVTVTLSDLFPNVDGFRRLAARSQGRLRYCTQPIDAGAVPRELGGLRTLFNSLHHFDPPAARAILGDAVRSRRAIAVFEGVNHRGVGMAAVGLQLPMLLLLTPAVRPFRWSRLALTYVLPLIPLLVAVDGVVSILRLYMPDELRELVAGVPGQETFEWDIGSTMVAGTSLGVTHLVGVPRT